MYGTGTLKGLEHEYIDMYIEQSKTVQGDFVCVNEELWKFLFERYGGQVIKRYYVRSSSMSYTNVDSKLKAVCIKILNT